MGIHHLDIWKVAFASLLFLAAPTSGLAQSTAMPAHAILGEWRGTSLCTNLQLAPACKDEDVRYVFTQAQGKANAVHLLAEKLVSGQYQPMYEIDLEYVDSDREWRYDFQTPRFKSRWFYTTDGLSLSGGLLALDSRELVRKASAKRHGAQR